MLGTGQYLGGFDGDDRIGIAGIHVYSLRYNVASIGNVTTHPAHRGKGIAKALTAQLCLGLLKELDFIGLNVKADNLAAIHCYEQIGFTIYSAYKEAMLTSRASQ